MGLKIRQMKQLKERFRKIKRYFQDLMVHLTYPFLESDELIEKGVKKHICVFAITNADEDAQIALILDTTSIRTNGKDQSVTVNIRQLRRVLDEISIHATDVTLTTIDNGPLLLAFTQNGDVFENHYALAIMPYEDEDEDE
jgi:hypothetical protein